MLDESSIVSSIENSSSNENKHSSPINNTKLTPNPNCSFVTNKITSDINNTYSIPKNNLNSIYCLILAYSFKKVDISMKRVYNDDIVYM